MIEKEIKLSYHEYEELVKTNNKLVEQIEQLKTKENVVVLRNTKYVLHYDQYFDAFSLDGDTIRKEDEAKELISELASHLKEINKQINDYNNEFKYKINKLSKIEREFNEVKKKWWYKLFNK